MEFHCLCSWGWPWRDRLTSVENNWIWWQRWLLLLRGNREKRAGPGESMAAIDSTGNGGLYDATFTSRRPISRPRSPLKIRKGVGRFSQQQKKQQQKKQKTRSRPMKSRLPSTPLANSIHPFPWRRNRRNRLFDASDWCERRPRRLHSYSNEYPFHRYRFPFIHGCQFDHK